MLGPMVQPGGWGAEFHQYRDAAASWLAGHGFYHARQLAGPYHIIFNTAAGPGDILYPPTVLWLLVPFTVLPDVLWWAIPAAVIAVALWRLRPPAWVLAIAVVPWTPPDAVGSLIHGNPVIWVLALTWLGVAYGWGGAFVWLKPSLFPFLLVGIERRRWWLVSAGLALLTLPLIGLVPDFLRATLDSDGGLLYSVFGFPALAAPTAAWLYERRSAPRTRMTLLRAATV